MLEFVEFFSGQACLFEDGQRQRFGEFTWMPRNHSVSSVNMEQFAVTALAGDFLETSATQFANDLFGSRRQPGSPPDPVPPHRCSPVRRLLVRQGLRSVHGFRRWQVQGRSRPMETVCRYPRNPRAQAQGLLGSFRGHARDLPLATWRLARLGRNQSRCSGRPGLETRAPCTFACFSIVARLEVLA